MDADRVAVETPRGEVRTGEVVDVEQHATIAAHEEIVTVDVGVTTLRYRESKVSAVASEQDGLA